MGLEGLKKAIKLAGSQKNLAILCNLYAKNTTVKQQDVSRWLNISKKVTANYVLLIEKATQGQVTRYELRPDLYPPDEK